MRVTYLAPPVPRAAAADDGTSERAVASFRTYVAARDKSRHLVVKPGDTVPVLCEHSADGLRGLAVIKLEHAAEALAAAHVAVFE